MAACFFFEQVIIISISIIYILFINILHKIFFFELLF